MKKTISLLLAVISLLSVTYLGGVEAAAFFGYGARVVASEVNMIKTSLIGQKITFTDGDFKSALALADFDTITITEIPLSTEGTLLLSGRRVGKGRVIKRKNLGALVFIPASDSVTECKFKFTVEGYAGGAEIECIMKFIDKVNYAPEAIGDTVSASGINTQQAISVYGNLGATDPEGDKIEYIIVTYPKRGSLTFTEKESGRYCYTPIGDFVGKDKFTYVARDEYGNYSKPMTVSVKINERMCDTVYRDMEDREEYNAAVAMTAMGVMSGVQLGDDLYFEPDEKVSRAEFVAMAMKCAGIKADSSLSSTYFDDDDAISVSLKRYIATAQRTGLIVGDFKDGKLLFSPNEEITRYEAAKILTGIIGANEEGEESVFAGDNDIPIWARAGVYAMCSLGIFDTEDTSSLEEKITRADVAEYLYRFLKNR
ncbi:MAG: S-layer homology domain-containing protein [Clostridia bacterium]|nr:S-layer homology domain-containing protein [Clostridia bacterium]